MRPRLEQCRRLSVRFLTGVSGDLREARVDVQDAAGRVEQRLAGRVERRAVADDIDEADEANQAQVNRAKGEAEAIKAERGK